MSALFISCKYTQKLRHVEYDRETFSSRAHAGMKSQTHINHKVTHMGVVIKNKWHKVFSFDDGVVLRACLEGNTVLLQLTGNGEPITSKVMPSNLLNRLTRS